MAWAGIPPVGAMHREEVNRQKRIIEETTVDPVLRYQLREQRLYDGLINASAGLIQQAHENAKTYQQIVENSDKITKSYYKYKEI